MRARIARRDARKNAFFSWAGDFLATSWRWAGDGLAMQAQHFFCIAAIFLHCRNASAAMQMQQFFCDAAMQAQQCKCSNATAAFSAVQQCRRSNAGAATNAALQHTPPGGHRWKSSDPTDGKVHPTDGKVQRNVISPES